LPLGSSREAHERFGGERGGRLRAKRIACTSAMYSRARAMVTSYSLPAWAARFRSTRRPRTAETVSGVMSPARAHLSNLAHVLEALRDDYATDGMRSVAELIHASLFDDTVRRF
jgi:hypothetical protein